MNHQIFGDKIYKDENDNEVYRLDNGKIFYNQNEYEIGTDGFSIHMLKNLTGDTYDYFKRKSKDYICFKIDNEKIYFFVASFNGEI